MNDPGPSGSSSCHEVEVPCGNEGLVESYPPFCILNTNATTGCNCTEESLPKLPCLPDFDPPPTTTPDFDPPPTTTPGPSTTTTEVDVTSRSTELTSVSTITEKVLPPGSTTLTQSPTGTTRFQGLTNGSSTFTDTTDQTLTSTVPGVPISPSSSSGEPEASDALPTVIIIICVCLLLLCIALIVIIYRKYKGRQARRSDDQGPDCDHGDVRLLSVSPTEGIKNHGFDDSVDGGGGIGTGGIPAEPHNLEEGIYINDNNTNQDSKAATEEKPGTVAALPPADVMVDQPEEKEKKKKKTNLSTKELPPLQTDSGRPKSDIAF